MIIIYSLKGMTSYWCNKCHSTEQEDHFKQSNMDYKGADMKKFHDGAPHWARSLGRLLLAARGELRRGQMEAAKNALRCASE